MGYPQKKIYDLWDKTCVQNHETPEIKKTVSIFKQGQFPLSNGLEKPAAEVYPELKELREILTGMGARNVSMTGSGPTFYAVFREEKTAKIIYTYLKDSRRHKVFLVHGISGWHKF